MTTLRDIFNAFAPEYLARYPNLPTSHRKAISAIQHCQSGHYGYSLYQCQSCGEKHRVNRSCGNRHCPQCQQHKTQQWLQHHLDKQLPGPHFLLTFTVPETLRPFMRSHQRLAYQAMFQASSTALKRLAKDQRFIGTDLPGFTGVLHTWGRQLQYHPHIHYIVPGGGLSKDRDAWLPSRANFYVPVRALSPIYRAIFAEAIRTAGLLEQIDPQVWQMPWNVHSQAQPHGATALTYLAPYVFKVAISNRRIVSLTDRIVTFTYRKPGSARPRTTQLDVLEFIRRFLQHVLPSGFMKVRHFGFMSASCPITTDAIRRMIPAHDRIASGLPPARNHPATALSCPHCGGELRVVSRVWSSSVALLDTS
jgi:hypothetical protein